MADLSTTYLGLQLKNPILASSCGITSTVNGVKQCADAGVGAIVLQSLFEEQIIAELGGEQGISGSAFPDEARNYLQYLANTQGPKEYLSLISDARETVDVPIIASINCVSAERWTDYAIKIETAGASAIELNIALMPISFEEEAMDIEAHLLSIVKAVRSNTKLPIAVKIGPYYTALPKVISRLYQAGVDGIILFNRFYQLDIDPVTLQPIAGNRFSTSDELPLPLRWMSILSPQIDCDFSLSTGVHTGTDTAKAIVAGAQVVQIASALYQRKVRGATEIISEFNSWLDSNGYSNVNEARGCFSHSDNISRQELERLQYIKALVSR